MATTLDDIARDFALADLDPWGVFDLRGRSWIFRSEPGSRLPQAPSGSGWPDRGLLFVTPIQRGLLTDGEQLSDAILLDIASRLQDTAMDELHALFPEVDAGGRSAVLEPLLEPDGTLAWSSKLGPTCPVGELARLMGR